MVNTHADLILLATGQKQHVQASHPEDRSHCTPRTLPLTLTFPWPGSHHPFTWHLETGLPGRAVKSGAQAQAHGGSVVMSISWSAFPNSLFSPLPPHHCSPETNRMASLVNSLQVQTPKAEETPLGHPPPPEPQSWESSGTGEARLLRTAGAVRLLETSLPLGFTWRPLPSAPCFSGPPRRACPGEEGRDKGGSHRLFRGKGRWREREQSTKMTSAGRAGLCPQRRPERGRRWQMSEPLRQPESPWASGSQPPLGDRPRSDPGAHSLSPSCNLPGVWTSHGLTV